jgi:hypothetical protein
MNYFTAIKENESNEIIPGFFARFIHTENVLLVFWEVKAGSTFPEHSHVHEQISTIQKGRFQLTINSETKNFKRRNCCSYSIKCKTFGYCFNRLQVDGCVLPGERGL